MVLRPPGATLRAEVGETRTLSACGLTLALALYGRAARAQPLPNEPAFTWSGPAECPAQQDVRRAIEDALGHPLDAADAGPARVRLRATVTRAEPDSFLLVLETTGADGTGRRELAGPSCPELADAAAVIAALAFESGASQPATTPSRDALGAAPPRASAPPPPPAPPPLPAESLTPSPAPLIDREGPPHPELRLSAAADTGTLPHPAAGVGVGASFGSGWLRVDAAATLFFDRRATLGQSPTAGADLRLVEASVGACHALPIVAHWTTRLCATLHAGLLHADAFGAPGAHAADSPWAAASADGALWWSSAGPVSFFVAVGALVPLTRPHFVLGDGREVHRPEAASARLSLGPAFCWR